MNIKNKNSPMWLLWFIEGVIVGFGAIMPGISGGTLCVAFGMYLPIIEVMSKPAENIKKYWKMLFAFCLGGGVGFVGLSGFAGWLMGISSELVTYAFIGFIIGTFPELWHDAGEHGRRKSSYLNIAVGFILMLTVLLLIKNSSFMEVNADIYGFLLCGVLWGLSFIVPGLSSSTLLLFFGLYQPMLDGIGRLDMSVVIPIGIGGLACVGLLSKVVDAAYKKYYTGISHFIIGVVAATTVMIFPSVKSISVYHSICLIAGAIVSYSFTVLCANLKKQSSAD